MLDGLEHLFSERPAIELLRDLLDIFLVAFLTYRALVVLKGTRAMQMGIGFMVFGLLYLAGKYASLATLQQLLSYVGAQLILIMVVVFQNDIRRALIRVGSRAFLGRGHKQQSRVVEEVVAAATELARHRMGAIIALEQDANVLEFVRNDGIAMDSVVTRELLVSLFIPESVNKTHDGAVLIRHLRIARAGVFFPMPESKITDAALGSRHRAAIGITEETDAVVVVVSEERGTISLCQNGEIESNLDGQQLKDTLIKLFTKAETPRSKRAPERAPVSERPSARPPTSTLPRGRGAAGSAADATGAHEAIDSVRPGPLPRARTTTPMPVTTPRELPPEDLEDDDVAPGSRGHSRSMTPSAIPASLIAAATNEDSQAGLDEPEPEPPAPRGPSRPMPQAQKPARVEQGVDEP
ncbi:MAG: TIGR00159 family protein [Myxococcales bacterium]|nr:TIGR00159 family protein [Myxococcales bacterium]